MSLYHTEVFMPEYIIGQLPTKVIGVTYSKHAVNASQTDRYGEFALPSRVNLAGGRLIEAETNAEKKVIKWVLRFSLNDAKDIIIVMNPEQPYNWFCRTVWLNLKSDCHRTLDKEKYATV